MRVVWRLGSKTTLKEAFARVSKVTKTKGFQFVEINTPEACKTSANKILMKKSFDKGEVSTPEWFVYKEGSLHRNGKPIDEIPFPILAKKIWGSRGRGMAMIKNRREFDVFIDLSTEVGDLKNYYFEQYYDYGREYRLHVSPLGLIYTNRKVRKKDTPEGQWHLFNNSNSNWILQENALFDEPANFQAIVDECVKALNSTGLTVGACDVRVQKSTNSKGKIRENPKFTIIEINSAPSIKEIGKQAYGEHLPKLVKSLPIQNYKECAE